MNVVEPLSEACEQTRLDLDSDSDERLAKHQYKKIQLKPSRGKRILGAIGTDLGVYSTVPIHTLSKSVSKLYDATANLNADIKQLNSEIGDLSEQMAVTDSVRHVLEFRDLVSGVDEFTQAIRHGKISAKAIETWTGDKLSSSIDLSLLSSQPVCYFNKTSMVLTVSASVVIRDHHLSLLAPNHFTLFNDLGCSLKLESTKLMLFNKVSHQFCFADANLDRLNLDGYFLTQPCSPTNSSSPPSFKRDCSRQTNSPSARNVQVKRSNNHYRVYCYHSSILINGTHYDCPNEVFRVPFNIDFQIGGVSYLRRSDLSIDLEAKPDSKNSDGSLIHFINPAQARLYTDEMDKIIADFLTEKSFLDSLVQTFDDSVEAIEAFAKKYALYILFSAILIIVLCFYSFFACYRLICKARQRKIIEKAFA